MNTLPDEILHHIILYCSIDDIKNLSIANKTFNVICNDSYLWYKLIEHYHIRLPNYAPEKNYRKIYRDICHVKFFNCDKSVLAQMCIDTFYCWISFDIFRANIFTIPDDPGKFRIFIDFSKRFLSADKFKELLYQTRHGNTILYYTKNVIIIQMILDEIDDKNIYCLLKNSRGCTALHKRIPIDKLKFLLNNVTDPQTYCSMVDYGGETPLFYNRYPGAIKTILSYIDDKDTYLKTQNIINSTILHLVAYDYRQRRVGAEASIKYIIDNITDLDSICEMKIMGQRRFIHFFRRDIKVHKFQYNFMNNNVINYKDQDIFPRECTAEMLDIYIGEKPYIKSIDENKNLYIIHISDILYYILRRLKHINVHLNDKPTPICLCGKRKFACICSKTTVYFTFDLCATLIKPL